MRFDTTFLCESTGGRILAGPAGEVDSVSIDTRTLRPGAAFFCIRGERFDGHDFAVNAVDAGASVVVADKEGSQALNGQITDAGITIVEVNDTVTALGDLARASRTQMTGPVIGLTGSSGKTTTKEMVRAVLETRDAVLATPGNLNNHLGLPLTLMARNGAEWAAVIEMGMNAPGEISYLGTIAQPTIGVVTTVGAAHLEGLGSLEAIARAKAELFDGLGADALAILPGDVAFADILTANTNAKIIRVGREEIDSLWCSEVSSTSTGVSATVCDGSQEWPLELSFVGEHNLSNALLALTVGRLLGIDMADGIRALEVLQPPPLRGELRALPQGGEIVLDCYNANPQSVRAAVTAFVERYPRGIIVLGDMLELGAGSEQAHRELGRWLADKLGEEHDLLGIGPEMRLLVDAAIEAGRSRDTTTNFLSLESELEVVAKFCAGTEALLLKGSRGMRLERIWDVLGMGETTP